MNARIISFFIAILGTLLLLAGIYVWLNQEKVGENAKAPTKREDISPVLKFIEVPLLTDLERKEADPHKNYSVNIHYPKMALANHDALAKEANAVIFTFVDDTIRDFKNDIADLQSLDIPKEFTSDLTMRWRAELVSPTIISIRFDYSEYIAGAAHPNTQNKVLNYDIEERLILKTEDLFASSTESSPFLSSFTQNALLGQASRDITEKETRDMIISGTAPSPENFANVAIGPDGLVVLFNPYQVAPYARGSQEVRIPLSLLRDLLSPRILDAMQLGKMNIREATPEVGEEN